MFVFILIVFEPLDQNLLQQHQLAQPQQQTMHQAQFVQQSQILPQQQLGQQRIMELDQNVFYTNTQAGNALTVLPGDYYFLLVKLHHSYSHFQINNNNFN